MSDVRRADHRSAGTSRRLGHDGSRRLRGSRRRHPDALLGPDPDAAECLPRLRGRARGRPRPGAGLPRRVEPGMRIQTDSARVRHARKLVLEFLASAVDVSTAPAFQGYLERYGGQPERFAGGRTVAAPPKLDNQAYVRDYAKCILCYKCVQACGVEWQNTFAIGVAGRGFGARIATKYEAPLPDSACVTAATASLCARRERSSAGRSSTCARRRAGTRRARPGPTPSAPTAASAACSRSTSRTIGSSR